VSDLNGSSEVGLVERQLMERFDGEPPGYIAVCGSNRLIALASRLRARWGSIVEASLEAHMACGLGYCHGCAAPLASDPSREGPLVCVDGPVFSVAGA
jgi:dihydroorotate dehydrogenase electron transfer subunit